MQGRAQPRGQCGRGRRRRRAAKALGIRYMTGLVPRVRVPALRVLLNVEDRGSGGCLWPGDRLRAAYAQHPLDVRGLGPGEKNNVNQVFASKWSISHMGLPPVFI